MSKSQSWTLPAAALLGAGETALLMAVVMARSAPDSALSATFLAVKLPFCWLAAGRRPGAYLGLVLWETAAIVIALTADVSAALRAIELVLAATVLGLLVASARLFPTVELPKP